MNRTIPVVPNGATGAVDNMFLDVGKNPPVVTGASRYGDSGAGRR